MPDGRNTVTVDGHVYDGAEVNYFLYGVWSALTGTEYEQGYAEVAAHAIGTTEGAAGKLAWYKAGYYENFSFALPAAIPNVLPAVRPRFAPYGPKLEWFIGTPLDQNDPYAHNPDQIWGKD